MRPVYVFKGITDENEVNMLEHAMLGGGDASESDDEEPQ